MNTNYTITVGNKKHEWTAETVESKLSQIGKLQGKNVCWIRSDLSVKTSNWLTRFFWKIAKHFSWMRKRFYHVDLNQSRSVLTQIGKQIPENTKVTDLYNKAVAGFNRIAPRHSLVPIHPLVQAINANKNTSLYDLGLKTPEEALVFLQEYGSHLESLNLSKLKVKNADLKLFFKACPNLLHFEASIHFANSALSDLVKKCPSLQSLHLSSCKEITDEGLRHLKDLSSLQSLYLSGCEKVTDEGLRHLKDLPSLQTLDLSYCKNITDHGLRNLKDLSSLQSLDLSFCKKITDHGLQHLKEISSLQSLDLCECKNITDDGLQHLKDLSSLQSLGLMGCVKITDQGLRNLKNLSSLQSLYLSFCKKITDEGLRHLKDLPSLQNLDLCYCKNITDHGLQHLKELSSLQSLDLSECEKITRQGTHMLEEAITNVKITM